MLIMIDAHYLNKMGSIECLQCVNSTANPVITISERGLCQICEAYNTNFNLESLKKELDFFLSLRKHAQEIDCLVGISGGKDSSATLITLVELGFKVKAFTLDSGYYPQHIFSRSEDFSHKLHVQHQVVDIRHLIRPYERACFQLFADLYEMNESEETKTYFRNLYQENRNHYSVRDTHTMPFVRSCQICRKIVIRAYYELALKNNVSIVVLGMNEWAGLSNNQFLAIRKLQPNLQAKPIYIVHLPFLLQRTATDTKAILTDSSWQPPTGEDFIESNSNSCLLARSTELKANQLLGFHPDSMRLAREVTVGFLTKEQAKNSLINLHSYQFSPKHILVKAGII